MSDVYTVNLYFDKPLTEEQKASVEERLNRAYYKDSIDEQHTYLEDEQTEEEEKTGAVPNFETAFKRYYGVKEWSDRLVGCEWNEEGRELDASFSGWECCRDAVKVEARKLMKEF